MKGFSLFSRDPRYDRLEQTKQGEIESLESPSPSVFSRPAGIVIHALLATLWLSITWYILQRDRGGPGLRALEFAPVASAIEYHDVVFDMSGMGTRANPVTEYEGPPSPENNIKWYELLNAGIIALDENMFEALGQETEPSSATDSTPLIHLEVFHQLHCLNSLRRLIYNTSTFTTGVNAEMHMDHCIDYLRQSIMCHGDVTPLVHIPRPGGPRGNGAPWMPNFRVKHTCRNFWKIHEWAAQYNTSGWTIEGYPNQGVDLAE
ncbi:uncharacterized protein N7459_009150 [Penicillium hispanicum]|uniref:uncharacterized protein n=1 Tax=Penicillium hispanicum TaxID=1080232 RepID=UPI0025404E22|nr:uncharacterized protein N7459_009150 [Penicillium hispanicum]KAJ5569720.1 hypothetical protein N7459_009150 [Penicillium hispanicum]